MKKLSFFLLVLLSGLYSLQAQAEITRTVFIPPEYYIGDPVELRIQLELDRNEPAAVPLHFDEQEWVDISDIQLTQDRKNVEITIHFTSFSPGTRALPSLDFGPFTLENFKIYTKSMVEEGETELKGLQPQIMIPGSRLYFFLLALAVFIFPYLLYFLLRMAVSAIVHFVKMYHIARPYRNLGRALKKLDAGLEKISVRDFFITLTDALREYLTARTGFDCKSSTTSEISRLHGFGLDETLWQRLVSVLKLGDLVKFGGETLTAVQMRENLDFVTTLCMEIEKREDLHADP